jgi:hypothetical protein
MIRIGGDMRLVTRPLNPDRIGARIALNNGTGVAYIIPRAIDAKSMVNLMSIPMFFESKIIRVETQRIVSTRAR